MEHEQNTDALEDPERSFEISMDEEIIWSLIRINYKHWLVFFIYNTTLKANHLNTNYIVLIFNATLCFIEQKSISKKIIFQSDPTVWLSILVASCKMFTIVYIYMRLLKREALRGHKHWSRTFTLPVLRMMRKTDVLRAELPSMSSSRVGDTVGRVP